MDFLMNGVTPYRNTTGNTSSSTSRTNESTATGSISAGQIGDPKKTKGKSDMDMNDFLRLLVTQLQNQDMMNPVSDTDFIAQMAQFSALQGVNTLQEYTLSSYAVSYVGKNVLIATTDKTGSLTKITGVVERVTFAGGTPKVVVDGVEYDLHTVMEIAAEPIELPEDNTTKPDGGTGGE